MKLREWLIRLLGGYTKQDLKDSYDRGKTDDKNVIYFLNEDNFRFNEDKNEYR